MAGLQRRQGAVHAGYVWLALWSALVFAAGHLPAAAALVDVLDASIVAFVIGWNAAFGLLFGYLFGDTGSSRPCWPTRCRTWSASWDIA